MSEVPSGDWWRVEASVSPETGWAREGSLLVINIVFHLL